MNDGLVHIAFYDGLVHWPDGTGVTASPPGSFYASPPGEVHIPIPLADQTLHVIPENFVGHVVNELV